MANIISKFHYKKFEKNYISIVTYITYISIVSD